MMNKKSVFIISLVIAVLLISNLVLISKYFAISAKLRAETVIANTNQINSKILDFTSMFITKVLESKTDVDFETRMTLETSVRGLNDVDILADWQKFVNSKTEVEAQGNVNSLLQLLVSKIKK